MPNEVMQGVDIATNAYKRLNARTACALYENTNAGIGNAKVFNDTFTKPAARYWPILGWARHQRYRDRDPIAGLGAVDVIRPTLEARA
jgi:hypothetical protein